MDKIRAGREGGYNKSRRGHRLLALVFLAGTTLTSSATPPLNFPQPPLSRSAGETPDPTSGGKAERRPVQAQAKKEARHLRDTHHPRTATGSRSTIHHADNRRVFHPLSKSHHLQKGKGFSNKHGENLRTQETPLPELIAKYLNDPELFIKFALNTDLTLDKAMERKMFKEIESRISEKYERHLTREISRDFKSTLNTQLTLLVKGQIDEISFQDALQKKVTDFLHYLEMQEKQGLPNLGNTVLAGLLLGVLVTTVDLRKDIFSKGNRLRLATVSTVLGLILSACGADQTVIIPPDRILDTQGVCLITNHVTPQTTVASESLLSVQNKNPGIYTAGAIFLFGRNQTIDVRYELSRYFTKTIPAYMLIKEFDLRAGYRELPKNTVEVQNSILHFFLGEGNRSLTWKKVMGITTGGGGYGAILTDIQNGALTNGRYSLVGYGNDLWQSRSNIGRSIVVVKNNSTGAEYLLKIQPLSVARTEVNGLAALNQHGINVAQVETYMPMNANRLSVSIQPYIRGGITVADYLNPNTPGINGVTMEHLERFYKRVYAAIVREAGTPNKNGKSLAIGDLINMTNVIITPDGEILVIDANSGMRQTAVNLIDGKYLVKGSRIGFTGVQRAVIDDLQYFMRVTFGTNPDDLPTILPPESNNLTYLRRLPSNTKTDIKLTDSDGNVKFEATVKNNGSMELIVPDKIPVSRWQLLNASLNNALVIVAGVGAGYEFVHQTGLGDSVVLTQSPSLIDRGRFGLGGQQIDDFVDSVGARVDTRALHSWQIPMAFITDTALPNAEWINSVRGELSLPRSTGEIIPELRLTMPDPLGNSIVLNNVALGTDTRGQYIRFSFPDCSIKDQRIYIGPDNLSHHVVYSHKKADDPMGIVKYDEALANYIYHLTTYSELQKKLTEEVQSGRMLFAVPVKSKDIHGRDVTYVVYGVLAEDENGKLNLEIFFLTSKRIFDDPFYKVKGKDKSKLLEMGVQMVVLERVQR